MKKQIKTRQKKRMEVFQCRKVRFLRNSFLNFHEITYNPAGRRKLPED